MTSVVPPNVVLSSPWIATPTDGLTGETLTTQLQTESTISDQLSPYLPSFTSDTTPLPPLNRQAHLSFLTKILTNTLPPQYTGLDASRPWLLYWSLHSLALLGGALDSPGKKRVVETLRACQNDEGGFGGGPGQISHLAPSYAAVCAIAYVGLEEGWEMVDRRGMLEFLKSVKQEDGSFVMHKGGEVDVRGCYCALTIATLLNLLTPSLIHNTSSFIVSCQTYEGGLASSSHLRPTSATFPSFRTPAPALGEAHGGYAFCAAASYAMLLPFTSSTSPSSSSSSSPSTQTKVKTRDKLDLPNLLRWTAALQAYPIEGAGFRGRTNKLVDGCYGWWGGGLFGVLGGLMGEEEKGEVKGGELFDRVGLQTYILLLAQSPLGGLRDKPGKSPDAYHTCYNLSGLSSAQHDLLTSPKLVEAKRKEWTKMVPELVGKDGEEKEKIEVIRDEKGGEEVEEAEERMKETWSRAVAWEARDAWKVVLGDEENELEQTHPLFNIEISHAKAMLDWFYLQQ